MPLIEVLWPLHKCFTSVMSMIFFFKSTFQQCLTLTWFICKQPHLLFCCSNLNTLKPLASQREYLQKFPEFLLLSVRETRCKLGDALQHLWIEESFLLEGYWSPHLQGTFEQTTASSTSLWKSMGLKTLPAHGILEYLILILLGISEITSFMSLTEICFQLQRKNVNKLHTIKD